MRIPPERLKVFVGFSANEMVATRVAESSIHQYSKGGADIRRICRLSLYPNYTRPTEYRAGTLWDAISGAPMSTDHAIARFFIPWLCDYQGWALFTDGDILCRRNVADLFALADDRYALMCVQHGDIHSEGVKKDGAIQQSYPRKNQSSVMLMNCAHKSNMALTLDVLNAWPGRDLHAFRWLQDHEIGQLPAQWNYLVNVNEPMENPSIVHYTLGTPNIPGHERDPWSQEWFATAKYAGYAFGLPVEMV